MPNVKVADTTLAVADTFDGGAVLNEAGNLLGLLNVFERRLKFVVPASALAAMKPGPLVKFKSWTPEEYMDSVEAGWLSGRSGPQTQREIGKALRMSNANVRIRN